MAEKFNKYLSETELTNMVMVRDKASGKVLVQQRVKSWQGLSFPGGHVEEGESFVPKYKAMLKATPTCTIEEAGTMMGVDLTDKKFWQSSLALIAKDIEAFWALVK